MNMRSFLFFQLFLALSFVSFHTGAEEISVPQCPQQLPIQQKTLTQPADGWKVVNSEKSQWLEHIAISAWEYPTVQTGFNIPITEKLPKGDRIAHYETGPDTSGVHDYWVICQYMNSAVVLVQKIPENAMRCEIKYINDATVSDRITIKCFNTPRVKK